MFGAKLGEANKTIASQREMLSQQEDRLRKLQERADQLDEDFNKVVKQRDELEVQVREQTEADLLLVSMKIVEKIKSGVKQGSLELGSLQQEQKRLRAAMGSYGYRYGYRYGTQGLQAMAGRML